MRIHYLQHVSFEGLGNIEPWAIEQGHALSRTRFFADEPLPMVGDFDWLVILGGPMNVYEHDRYPWLTAEKAFISESIGADKRVLGICLGAQLIADVLGGPVGRNRHREIGWHDVELTASGRQSPLLAGLPERFTPFHWHGDTFAIPPGAEHLASSSACQNQAFQYGDRVLGVQFHLDYAPESVELMIRNCASDLAYNRYVQPPDVLLASSEDFADARQLLHQLLDAMGR